MNYKQAIEFAASKLLSISESAKLDAQLLICHACNLEHTKLLTHPENELNDQQLESFNSALERRTKGEPLAYITGTKEFWSLEFIVNEHVLVPRPETELLVELTLKEVSKFKTPRILDLGTGSGIIAIALAKQCSKCLITATDISHQALKIAKENAKKHKVAINFIQSDWYGNIENKKFDVIVCNPPYIAKDDSELDKFVMQYEPYDALISNGNGLKDIETVVAGAKKRLHPTGSLIIEHGFQQALSVNEMFIAHKFNNVFTSKDLAGLDRATIGTLN